MNKAATPAMIEDYSSLCCFGKAKIGSPPEMMQKKAALCEKYRFWGEKQLF